jgi:hypothetical protein
MRSQYHFRRRGEHVFIWDVKKPDFVDRKASELSVLALVAGRQIDPGRRFRSRNPAVRAGEARTAH